MDPDGRKFNLTYLSPTEKRIFEKAIQELKKIKYATEIINLIENSEQSFIVKINQGGVNNYDPKTKVLSWDPQKYIYKKRNPKIVDAKIEYEYIDYIDSLTLLFHELGHIEQELSGLLITDRSLTKSEKYQIENDNLLRNEQNVAEKRKNYKRSNYNETFFTTRKYPEELIEVLDDEKN